MNMMICSASMSLSRVPKISISSFLVEMPGAPLVAHKQFTVRAFDKAHQNCFQLHFLPEAYGHWVALQYFCRLKPMSNVLLCFLILPETNEECAGLQYIFLGSVEFGGRDLKF